MASVRRRRPQNSGSLSSIGSGKWLVRVSIRDPRDGSRHFRTKRVTGTKTQAEAELTKMRASAVTYRWSDLPLDATLNDLKMRFWQADPAAEGWGRDEGPPHHRLTTTASRSPMCPRARTATCSARGRRWRGSSIATSYLRTDKNSGIVNDPTDWSKEVGDRRYIIDFFHSSVPVTLEAMQIVDAHSRQSSSAPTRTAGGTGQRRSWTCTNTPSSRTLGRTLERPLTVRVDQDRR